MAIELSFGKHSVGQIAAVQGTCSDQFSHMMLQAMHCKYPLVSPVLTPCQIRQSHCLFEVKICNVTQLLPDSPAFNTKTA